VRKSEKMIDSALLTGWCVLVRSYAFDEDMNLLAITSDGVLEGLALLSMLLLF
jgi:hypothetical protein